MSTNDKIIKHMLRHIPHHAKVLDLGCGNGELLAQLKRLRQVQGYGIEINFDNVLACIQKGISVYQGDLDEGLSGIPDDSYDVVILSLTLQEIMKPAFLITEIMRVGKTAIITFPNFGHWALRYQLLVHGKTPVTKSLPFSWHNTPNLRMLTCEDFKDLCRELKLKIIESYPISNSKWAKLFPKSWSNLMAEKGMFVIEKTTTLKPQI